MAENQTRHSLEKDIWRACDIMRRDNNCGGVMEYIEHLAWILLLRFLDAQEENWDTQAQLDGGEYRYIMRQDLRWRNWATRDWPADDLIGFVHGTLIPYLRDLTGDPIRDTLAGVFSGERNVVVCGSGYNLKEVLLVVNTIDFHNSDDTCVVSKVYEDLLRRLGNENKVAGEFYTPRPVIRFVVDAVSPQLGETVYDPACGSCGFLAQAFQRMKPAARTIEDERMLQESTFFGQEKKAVAGLLGMVNMVLHGITAPNIRRVNTLEEDVTRVVTDRYDAVMTNPPFGGMEGGHIQRNFPKPTQATELLFIEHIMKKLKPRDGSRCGMVVPEGTLFRGGVFAEVKEDLMKDFDLHTVVSLPPGTFAPYSDVKTALIFFDRPGPTKEVWYYELPIPEGLKKFSKGSPIQDLHFEELRALWNEWKDYRSGDGQRPEPTERSWIVGIEEIKEKDFDLTARNPNRPEGETLPPPMELVASLMERERQILSIVEELDELLGNGNGEEESE